MPFGDTCYICAMLGSIDGGVAELSLIIIQ